MIVDTIKGALALLIVGAIAGLAFLGWQEWRTIREERRTVAEAEVRRQRAVVAELKESHVSVGQRLETAVAGSRSILLAPKPRRPQPPPPRPSSVSLPSRESDSLHAIIRDQGVEVASLRAWGDSLEKRLDHALDTLGVLLVAVERYRWSGDSVIAAHDRQMAAMQVALDSPAPRRRWGLGVAGGYCSLLEGADPRVEPARRPAVRHGPGACLGLTFSF